VDIKVTYTAIAAAVLLGATTVGQYVANSRLQVEVRSLQHSPVACQQRSEDTASTREGLRQFFGGKKPPPQVMP